MNKILGLFLFFILISNCSLDKKSGIWQEEEKEKILKEKLVVEELFKDEKTLSEEVNSNVRISLSAKLLNDNFINNPTNNDGRINYNGVLEKISKYKFSKIDNFIRFEPEIVFDKKSLIFFDNKGSILKFDQNSKLIWKKNYYTKGEKKLKPMLSMANFQNYLVIVDNLAKYYALDIKTGKLIWMKSNVAPFNSQIKIYKNKIFVVDFQNILRCFSIETGDELWNVITDNSFVKSQKKLSLVISNNKVFFNNTIGDISAVDIKKGKLIWQTPTQDSSIFESSFQIKTSDLIVVNNKILFSNNKNEFYCLDIKTGTLIWKNSINSSIKPTVIDGLVFTVSEDGYLIIIENKTGNIIRSTNIFKQIKEKKRLKIKPVGFIVGKENIYFTTSNGRLIVADVSSGNSNLILKIDNEKISRPFVVDKNLFIIKNNAIIKLN